MAFEVLFGTQNGIPTAFYQGQNLITGSPPTESFQEEETYTLTPQVWKPILVQTTQGFVIIEMQDQSWIYRTHSYPSDAADVISETFEGPHFVRTFGQGQEYSSHVNVIMNTRALGELLNVLTNSVTIYWENSDDSLTVCYRGSDGRYYDLGGDLDSDFNPEGSTLVPIKNDLTYFRVTTDDDESDCYFGSIWRHSG